MMWTGKQLFYQLVAAPIASNKGFVFEEGGAENSVNLSQDINSEIKYPKTIQETIWRFPKIEN